MADKICALFNLEESLSFALFVVFLLNKSNPRVTSFGIALIENA